MNIFHKNPIKKLAFTVIFGSLCTVACASKRGSLFESKRLESEKIICADRAVIVDLRPSSKSNKSLNVPGITFPGNHNLVRPDLPANLAEYFQGLLSAHCKQRVFGYTYEVQIVEGLVAFKATFTSEIEIASATYHVTLRDERGVIINEWTGDKYGEYESIDADEERVLRLLTDAYIATFREAIYALRMVPRI